MALPGREAAAAISTGKQDREDRAVLGHRKGRQDPLGLDLAVLVGAAVAVHAVAALEEQVEVVVAAAERVASHLDVAAVDSGRPGLAAIFPIKLRIPNSTRRPTRLQASS